MRDRKEIEKSYTANDRLQLEVLLDIRDLLLKAVKPKKKQGKKP